MSLLCVLPLICTLAIYSSPLKTLLKFEVTKFFVWVRRYEFYPAYKKVQFTFSTWWRCIIIPEDSTIWPFVFIFTQIQIIRCAWDTPSVMSRDSCDISCAELTLITWKRESILAYVNRNIYIKVRNSEYWYRLNRYVWILGSAASMLVTAVGDKVCWWSLRC